FRVAVTVSEPANLTEALLHRVRGPFATPQDRRPRLVFVCPGQGAQWLGMGRSLLEAEPVFHREIQACDHLIREQCGWSLIDELLAAPEQSRLLLHDVAQLAIFSISVALGTLWRSWSIIPDALVGHSVGEVAACVLGGVLSRGEGIRVVANRARL